MIVVGKSLEQLAREDLIRQALEAAAKRIESFSCNKTYQRALAIGARMIRDMAAEQFNEV